MLVIVVASALVLATALIVVAVISPLNRLMPAMVEVLETSAVFVAVLRANTVLVTASAFRTVPPADSDVMLFCLRTPLVPWHGQGR